MFGSKKKIHELEQNFSRLGLILDAMDIPVWQRDDKLNIIFCNNSYLRIAEIPKGTEEIADLSKDVKALAENAVKSKSPLSKRLKIVSQGSREEYKVHEIPTINGSVGYAISADEQVRTEEEMKRNSEVQKQLLETTASAIAVYGTDQRLRFFNNAFINLWKLDEAWLGTQPAYGEVLEALREKRKLPEQANFLDFKKKNVAMFTNLMEPREEYYFLPDDRALRVIVIPNALGGLQIAYEDMTDKLALERSYNTLLDVQSETLANLHEGVAVFGESGKLTLSNNVYAKIWGLEEKYLESEPLFNDILEKTKKLYQHEGDWDDYKKTIISQTLNSGKSSTTLELSNSRLYNVKTTPLPDGEMLITYDDITDSALIERSLRESNQALEDVDRLKTEFLTNVSYELRSPLTSIMGFAEVLRQEIFGKLNKPQMEYLEDIYKASKSLELLINDILDISSIEAGYMKLNFERFDIHAMLASVIALVSERIQDQGQKIIFECSASIGKLMGDEKRIKQVVYNVITNSIKFTGPGGVITMGAKLLGTNIVIFIEDNGQGIPTEELQHIFKKFQKSKSKGGTGLGLSVAKNFVDLHNGTIEVESEPGKGTKVLINLPREQPLPQPNEKS